MARFAKWAEWKAMARDISNALSHLTIKENFDASEFLWQPFTPEVLAGSSMPLGDRSVVSGAYFFDVGNLVAFGADISVVVSASGTALRDMLVSLPYPYDPFLEQVLMLQVVAEGGPVESRSATGRLISGQWLAISVEEASQLTNWNPGSTYRLRIFGSYPKHPAYQYKKGPIAPDAPTALSLANTSQASPWTTWTPTLVSSSIVFTGVTNSTAVYQKHWGWVTCNFTILFTPTSVTSSFFRMMLPVNHAGFNSSCGTARMTNLTSGAQMLCVMILESGNLDRVTVGFGPQTPFVNLVLADNYRFDGTFTYRSTV